MEWVVDSSDRKPVGRTGESVSAVGLGTWAIRSREAMVEALVYAFESGIDNVDTAEMYGSGEAERIVGEALRRVGRDRVFVTTKLYPHRFRSREAALRAARASLERLGIREADLILIHWPDDQTPVEVQVRSLEALAEEGLTRYIGVSNFPRSLLEKAQAATRSHEIAVDQVHYSVYHRSGVEESLLPHAIRTGVTIQAYTPIERGRVAQDPLLGEIGEKYGKTPVQVALNYLISQPRVVAIPKTERRERVEEFLGAMGWRLSPEDLSLIRDRIRG